MQKEANKHFSVNRAIQGPDDSAQDALAKGKQQITEERMALQKTHMKNSSKGQDLF
jgi:hypothetical protein